MTRLPLIGNDALDTVLSWEFGRPVRAAQYLHDVQQLAKRLPSTKAILNICENRYNFLVCLGAGLVRNQPNVMPPSTAPEALADVATEVPDLCCVSDGVACPETIACVDLTHRSGPGAYEGPIPAFTADQIAAVVYTSGSTGKPVAHPKRWGEMVAGARITGRRLGLGEFSGGSIVATVPPQHMFGLETTVFLPLTWGIAVDTARPFFCGDLAASLEQVSAPRILVTTPIHIRACITERVHLPPVAFILSATAPLPQELAETAEKRFGCPVLEIYGSTETGAMATRRTAAGIAWHVQDGFDLKQSTKGWTVTAEHLLGPVPLGDQISAGETSGTFLLQGRASDLFKIGGKRGSLGDLNHKLTQIDGVVDGVFVVPEQDTDGSRASRLAALVVAPGRTESQILSALREKIDPVFLPRPLRIVDELPRNATGKLARESLLRLLDKDRRRKIN